MVIRFFASLRAITGEKEIAWEASTPTLAELLHQLSERYGAEFRRWVLEGDELGSGVLVIVNGQDVRHQAGLATRLAPADIVSLLPMMAGGGGQNVGYLTGGYSCHARRAGHLARALRRALGARTNPGH